MPKARRKKKTEFDNVPTKSVFLYGKPNKGKLLALINAERLYTDLVNQNIQLLSDMQGVQAVLVQNDKKDSHLRQVEKQNRPAGVNSAFCQNAFDEAVVKLSQRLNNIRLEMMHETDTILVRSQLLFGMLLDDKTRHDMVTALTDVIDKTKKPKQFYVDCVAELNKMSDEAFAILVSELRFLYKVTSDEFAIPYMRKAAVPMDSRLMCVEKSTTTAFPFVIRLTDPLHKNKRIDVPSIPANIRCIRSVPPKWLAPCISVFRVQSFVLDGHIAKI